MGFLFYKVLVKRLVHLSKILSISVGDGGKNKSVKFRVQNVKRWCYILWDMKP